MDKVIFTRSGFPFDSGRFSKEQTGRKPLIRIRDVVRGATTTFTDEECPDEYIIHSGDILIGMDGDFNVAKWQSEDALLNQRVCYISSASDALLYDYLFYYLPDPLKKINDATPSVTVKHLSTKTLEKTPIPIPPRPEQQRIVDRIEGLFAKLDKAKEKAQTVVDGFEDRKAAILHNAFNGELTSEWRDERGVTLDSWKSIKLIDILTEKPRNGYSPKPVAYATPYKSMTLSATTSGFFDAKHYKYIDADIPDDSYLWLKPNDILIQRANSLDKVGTSALYTGGEHEFVYPDLMMKLRVSSDCVPAFVAYSLKTQSSLTYFRNNATGTAGNMPKINQDTVSNTPMVLPQKDEQAEIVRILDSFFSKERETIRLAKQAISKIELEKQAILSLAFRGELGTNDPNEKMCEV